MTYSIIQADLKEHKELLISLWKHNFPGVFDKRFEWIYENNPGGPPTALLLNHDKSNAVVGAITLFPRTFYIDGRKLPAHILGDLAVDRGHRTLGPALTMLKAAVARCENDGSGILLGFPTSMSEPVTRRAGFQLLDDINEMTLVVRSYPYVLKYVPIPIIARSFAYPLDLFLQLRRGNLWQPHSREYETHVTDMPGEIFDILWSRLSNQPSLIGERGWRYINWRFFQSPYAKNYAFIILRRGSRDPLGYIIFNTTEKRVSVVDIGVPIDDPSLDYLLLSFANYQQTKGFEAISISLAGDRNLIKKLIQLGYAIRSKQSKIVVYAPLKLQEIIGSIQDRRWYLTAADNDI